MKATEIEDIEITLLLEAIFQRYGHDFRRYARASIERRVRNFLNRAGYDTIAQMIPKVLHDEAFFEQLILEFSLTVTEMFRDPVVYRTIRENLVPLLKTYPFIKIWHAGCATGEEVYSLAILLREENLYDRATIFATDFNDAALEKAKEGVYALDRIKKFTRNYQHGGGTASFSDYYHAQYGAALIDQSLKENITFANHNLVTDDVFSETNLIMCRNVLIYFDKDLQNRVLNLFSNSLAHGGWLCLGEKESLLFSDIEDRFVALDKNCRIYQKKTS